MPENALALSLVAIVLITCHLLSPIVQRASRVADAQVASFTGGLAASYVFLHLFAEINQAHMLIGNRIYLLVLTGFIIFYGMENYIKQTASDGENMSRRSYVLRIGFAALYNMLLVFTLGKQMPENHILSAMFAVALGLHLMATDIGLMKRFGKRFARWGRLILAGSLLLGLVLSLYLKPGQMLVDVLSASLAGFIMFTVFHEEVSQTQETSFRWFLGGAACLATLHLIIGT